MMRRLLSAAREWLDDTHGYPGVIELRIALAQAALVGVPLALIGLGLMAVLP